MDYSRYLATGYWTTFSSGLVYATNQHWHSYCLKAMTGMDYSSFDVLVDPLFRLCILILQSDLKSSPKTESCREDCCRLQRDQERKNIIVCDQEGREGGTYFVAASLSCSDDRLVHSEYHSLIDFTLQVCQLFMVQHQVFYPNLRLAIYVQHFENLLPHFADALSWLSVPSFPLTLPFRLLM